MGFCSKSHKDIDSRPLSAYASNMDGDGGVDVLLALFDDHTISLEENAGAILPTITKLDISRANIRISCIRGRHGCGW